MIVPFMICQSGNKATWVSETYRSGCQVILGSHHNLKVIMNSLVLIHILLKDSTKLHIISDPQNVMRVWSVNRWCLFLLGNRSLLRYIRGFVLAHLFLWFVFPIFVLRLITLWYLSHFIKAGIVLSLRPKTRQRSCTMMITEYKGLRIALQAFISTFYTYTCIKICEGEASNTLIFQNKFITILRRQVLDGIYFLGPSPNVIFFLVNLHLSIWYQIYQHLTPLSILKEILNSNIRFREQWS
jgi:hypothetical protein